MILCYSQVYLKGQRKDLIAELVAEGKREKRVTPPVAWYGGKIRMSSKIAAMLPEHNIYVEGFGGSGAVLFAKTPSPVEVYNDIDHGLVHFYRTLRDPDKAAQLIQFLALIPFSREEFNFGCANWDTLTDDIAKAAYWFIVARWSFGGIFGGGWSKSGRSWIPNHALTFQRAIDKLPEVHERLRTVQIENCSYEQLIKAHDSPQTAFYFDPPYMHDTRSAKDVYTHELTTPEHYAFIEHMKTIQGSVIISGYQSELYDSLMVDPKWKRIDVDVYTSASPNPKNKRRTECLWLNC